MISTSAGAVLVRKSELLSITFYYLYAKYWRVSGNPSEWSHQDAILSFRFTQTLMVVLPDRLFRLAGEILYRHVG